MVPFSCSYRYSLCNCWANYLCLLRGTVLPCVSANVCMFVCAVSQWCLFLYKLVLTGRDRGCVECDEGARGALSDSWRSKLPRVSSSLTHISMHWPQDDCSLPYGVAVWYTLWNRHTQQQHHYSYFVIFLVLITVGDELATSSFFVYACFQVYALLLAFASSDS